jgi:hypothetical protein
MTRTGTRSPIGLERPSGGASCLRVSAVHSNACATPSCRRAYLDGSFVTARDEPGDFDACWEIAGVDADLLDPVLLDFSNARAAQKERFGGELFPAEAVAVPDGTRFLDYFQRDKLTGDAKGIIAVDLKDMP